MWRKRQNMEENLSKEAKWRKKTSMAAKTEKKRSEEAEANWNGIWNEESAAEKLKSCEKSAADKAMAYQWNVSVSEIISEIAKNGEENR